MTGQERLTREPRYSISRSASAVSRFPPANGHTTAFAYGAAGRQIRRTFPGGDSETFQYDAAGNLSERTDFKGNSTTYGYDLANRLSQRSYPDGSAISFTYTATGPRASATNARGTTLYHYDSRNRLQRLLYPDGRELRHGYDADGNRVRTEITPATGPPATTDFLVDTAGPLSEVVAETDATGQLQRTYTRGNGLLATTSTTTEDYLADHLGSIRGLTDDQGNLTQSYTYTAFGTLLGPAPTHNNPYLFAGQRRDLTTGLDDLRARWMLPGLGRFASVDPFAGTLAQPISQHPYLYANSNPLRFVDPTGRVSFAAQVAIGAGIGAVLAVGITLVVNHILGDITTGAQILNAVIWGAGLGALATIHGTLALGVYLYVVGGSAIGVMEVELDPDATTRQRIVAWSLLLVAAGLGALGLRYYRSGIRDAANFLSRPAKYPATPRVNLADPKLELKFDPSGAIKLCPSSSAKVASPFAGRFAPPLIS